MSLDYLNVRAIENSRLVENVQIFQIYLARKFSKWKEFIPVSNLVYPNVTNY